MEPRTTASHGTRPGEQHSPDQAVKARLITTEVARMKLTPSEAATEAVIACFLNFMRSGGNPRAFTADQAQVRDWIGVVFGDDIKQIGAAMWYAERMLNPLAQKL